jgi:hypothetical protein
MTKLQQGPTNSAGSDPIDQVTSALQDTLLLGITTMNNMFTQGAGTSSDDLRAGMEGVGKQAHMATLVAKSFLIAATSGMRYLSGVAQLVGTHQTNILSSLASVSANKQLSEDERRAMAENMRAYLREIGDLAQQEARLLQTELGQVGEELARATREAGTNNDGRRYGRAKP